MNGQPGTLAPPRVEVAVFSPSSGVGGVERVGREVFTALALDGTRVRQAEGLAELITSPRPHSVWMSLTWKTHALVRLRHPGCAGPRMIWLHGAELTRDRGPQVWLRRQALDSADLLLAVSPLALELLPEHLAGRAHLVGPPVPDAALATRSRVTDDGTVRLLSVGRAIPRKGHDLAIESARCLSATRSVRLDIVGPGPDEARLRALADRVRSPRLVVHVRGLVPESVKQQLFADADVLLFLPRATGTEFEGLGLVVLEAAAQGCPAVVLDCGGSGLTLGSGSGVLLPADARPETVSDAATQLLGPAARAAATRHAEWFRLSDWRRRVQNAADLRPSTWQWPPTPDRPRRLGVVSSRRELP